MTKPTSPIPDGLNPPRTRRANAWIARCWSNYAGDGFERETWPGHKR